MISVITRICFCLLMLLAISRVAIASNVVQEDIVRRYCNADTKGARLYTNTYDAVRPYIAWNDESGWDHSFVIKSFDVIKSNTSKNGEISVEVKYKVIAIISGDEILSYNFVELVNFVLARYGNEWKITRPIIPPHVSVAAAIANIKDVIKSEADVARIRELKHQIGRLEEIKNKQ